MDSIEFPKDYIQLVASTADICMRPWKHSVIHLNGNVDKDINLDEPIELVLRIECRNAEGERCPENDLELEIFQSGMDLNLVIGWGNQLDRPILWHGQHSVWMDANTGSRCQAPEDFIYLEVMARRLRALFCISNEK